MQWARFKLLLPAWAPKLNVSEKMHKLLGNGSDSIHRFWLSGIRRFLCVCVVCGVGVGVGVGVWVCVCVCVCGVCGVCVCVWCVCGVCVWCVCVMCVWCVCVMCVWCVCVCVCCDGKTPICWIWPTAGREAVSICWPLFVLNFDPFLICVFGASWPSAHLMVNLSVWIHWGVWLK